MKIKTSPPKQLKGLVMDFTALNREQIVESVRNALEAGDIKYQYDEEKRCFALKTAISGPISCMEVRLAAREKDYFIVTTVPVAGIAKDAEQMSELLRLVAKINYRLIHGSFKIDVNDGELNFEVSSHTIGMDELPPLLILAQLALCQSSWERHLNQFVGVLFKGLSADEAYELEND